MPSLYMLFEEVPPDLTLDTLIDRIFKEFQGGEIIVEDLYAVYRKQALANMDRIRASGRIPTDTVLKSIDRNEAANGPKKVIRIPRGSAGSLEGWILVGGLHLSSDAAVDCATAHRLVALIQSLGISIQCFGIRNDTSRQTTPV